jgi:DNA-binding NtrC family response regulator
MKDPTKPHRRSITQKPGQETAPGSFSSASESPAMRETLQTIEKIAGGELNVMIVGEYGTGKEWAAHELHRLSKHASGPFIVVDCAAISPEEAEPVLFGLETLEGAGVEIRKGEFEEAAGGTILLNDIDVLPQHTQVRIARMIETGFLRRAGGEDEIPVSARVIATLHENGGNPPETEKLRQELYYRLSPVLMRIPPLRERKEDIPRLVETFLSHFATQNGSGKIPGISKEALELCKAYEWPGNVRHLKSAIEYASVMSAGETIVPQHLPPYLTQKREPAHS